MLSIPSTEVSFSAEKKKKRRLDDVMRGTKAMWGTATDVSNVITQAWNVKERQRKVAGAVSRNGLKL